MKFTIALFAALFVLNAAKAQKLDLDISLPQPRLGQRFDLTLRSDTLSKQIFNLPPDKFKINSYTAFTGQETSFSVNIEALKMGKNEIGPLTFSFNAHTYKTNSIKFTVADSLPNVNKGIWITKVHVDDTTVYIIIDQHIPTHNSITHKENNTTSMSAELNDGEKELTLTITDIENAKIEERGSSSETSPDFSEKGLGYGSYYKCYKVTVLDKRKPLVLTKAAFENLPDYYKFEDIVIN